MTNVWKTLAIIALLWSCVAVLPAQTRDVVVDMQGVLLAPDAQTLAEANALTRAQGGSIWTHFYDIDSTPHLRGDTSAPTASTLADAELQTWTVTHAITDYQLSPLYVRGDPADPITWASSDPATAIVNDSGFVTWIADGPVNITSTVGNFARVSPLTMESGSTYEVINILSGVLDAPHLREKITRPVDLAIAADDGNLEHELYTTKDWAIHTYVRNTNAYAYTLTGGVAPWTALAVWRTGKTTEALGQSIRGTLISPDLIAFAWHNAPAIGTQFRYLDTDNVVHIRTLTHRARLGTTDSGVGRLDAVLPATVHPAKLLPGDWSSYLSTQGTRGLQLPAITTNRNLRTGIADASQQNPPWFGSGYSHIATRQPYFLTPVNGDSGSPVFWTLNGQLILIHTWYTPMGGHDFPYSQVLNLSTALGAQPPTAADVSALTNFNAPPGP